MCLSIFEHILSGSGIMLQFVCFIIGAIFGGCFAATVMALIFAHTDLYVKDGDNNNEEESL